MSDLDDAAVATGRKDSLFAEDWAARHSDIAALVDGRSVLVAGGAGTIGAACVRLIIELGVRRLHIIDLDENGLARLAREIRAAMPQAGEVELMFLAADFGDYPAKAHLRAAGPFDLVLDFAAVKHVRSEKNVPALLHMIATNVVKQDRFLRAIEAQRHECRCFAVSTDKAADPANFMGASKRLMEEVLFALGDRRRDIVTCSSRFANVAFSSGSLLESFVLRLQAGRPLAAPRDTRRFFLSAREAAEICLLALVACPSGQLLVPRLNAERHAIELADVAQAFLHRAGFQPQLVEDVAEASALLAAGSAPGAPYPIVLTPRDTAGEKPTEVFVGEGERLTSIRSSSLEALAPLRVPAEVLDAVVSQLADRVDGRIPTAAMEDIGRIVGSAVPNFKHIDGEAQLDDRL
ncbi:MAG: polysaccharide biosynthesis protein [Xanthobacteraceae bacterium]